jgi:hypothetical protein
MIVRTLAVISKILRRLDPDHDWADLRKNAPDMKRAIKIGEEKKATAQKRQSRAEGLRKWSRN